MKTMSIRHLLCTALLFLSITRAGAKVATTPVYINSPDSSVHTNAISSITKLKPQMGRPYYWYSKNSIQTTDGGFSGKLLHGLYTSYHRDHNLKCQGYFDRGLKTGIWITWYSNGRVCERSNYTRGVVDGVQELYDSLGNKVARIYYKHGERAGKTKYFRQDGSDSVVRYKNGIVVVPAVKKDATQRSKKPDHKRSHVRDTTENHADTVRHQRTTHARNQRDSLHTSETKKAEPGTSGRVKKFHLFRRKRAHQTEPVANG